MFRSSWNTLTVGVFGWRTIARVAGLSRERIRQIVKQP
jgi:hypothetical protein